MKFGIYNEIQASPGADYKQRYDETLRSVELGDALGAVIVLAAAEEQVDFGGADARAVGGAEGLVQGAPGLPVGQGRGIRARLVRRPALATWLYAAAYVALVALLSLPLTLYRDFFREHRYGLATQGLAGFLGDEMKGLGVALALAPLLLAALYAVVRRAPRTWWLWGAGLALAFACFGLLIGPVYVDPRFNRYEPLPAGPEREEILSLARASGIDAGDVYRFDASRQTTRVSANVSGFLGTMRIRLNDNLLNRCTLPEIRAVMGHEIGHYALNHGKAALRRAARWDGWVIPGTNMEGQMEKSPEWLAEQVSVIRSQRTSSDPFDVAINGVSAAGDLGLPQSYAAAGATWWLECLFGMRRSVEQMLERVLAGPPG